jgi:ketosteroid isomerase-like protein
VTDDPDPLAAERLFFAALIAADLEDLDRVLADDFVLIDVMRGDEIAKAALVAVLGSGQLRFAAIEPVESRVRRYPGTTVVTGRTRMSGTFDGTRFTASSRYTHVYVQQEGRWRLVAAQGTQIPPEGQPATGIWPER